VDDIRFGPRASRRSSRATATSPEEEFVVLDVVVEPEEEALVLVERDGALEWVFPSDRAAFADTRQFKVRVVEDGSRAQRRGFALDKLKEFVVGRATATIIKFAARATGLLLVKLLEKKVCQGLVHLQAGAARDVTKWEHVAPSQLSVKGTDSQRVLLLVHGTFSSTVGSFGALTGHAAGQDLLEWALQHYDFVLGFDHRTLSQGVLENSQQIVDDLARAFGTRALEIDAIAFSRGGLVLRTIVEHLVVEQPWTFNRCLFIGCTNAGTELAEPSNWDDFVNLYTNLIVGSMRLMRRVGIAVASGLVVESTVNLLGTFARYLASTAVTERSIPGLADMAPNGEHVRFLNSRPAPNDVRYFAVTSDFQLSLFDATLTGLPQHLLGVLTDRVVDSLMGQSNDLVVNTGSMTQTGSSSTQNVVGIPVANRLALPLAVQGSKPVYHTVYFAQPFVAIQLTSWLRDEPGAVRGSEFGESDEQRSTARKLGGSRKKSDHADAARSLKLTVEWGDIARVHGVKRDTGLVLAAGHVPGLVPQYAEKSLDGLISFGDPDEGESEEGQPESAPRRWVLEEQTRRGILRGDLGAVELFPVTSLRKGLPRLKRLVAVCGLGEPGRFGELQQRVLFRNLASTCSMLPHVHVIATVLIGSGTVELGASVRNLILGVCDGLATVPDGHGIVEVRIVEMLRLRAERIFNAAQGVVAELNAAKTWSIHLEPAVDPGTGGTFSAQEKLHVLLASLLGSTQLASNTKRRKLVQQFLSDSELGGLFDGDSFDVISSLAKELKLPDTKKSDIIAVASQLDLNAASHAEELPVRLSYVRDNRVHRVAAVAQNSTIPERIVGVDPSLLAEAVRRMTDPGPEEFEQLTARLTRMVVPREFRLLLNGTANLVFDVDRFTAPFHWEMLPTDLDAKPIKPVGLTRPVARQLRTTYSPPPAVEVATSDKVRVLVIGDPQDNLPGARDEAREVYRFLNEQTTCSVELLIGSAGEGSFARAERFDVLGRFLDGGFHIIHYAGHGDFDVQDPTKSGWLFGDGLLTAREIEQIDEPPLLVLANACLSGRTSRAGAQEPESLSAYGEAALLPGLADEFLRRGVRNYIGTAWEVNDIGATAFALRFYERLFTETNQQYEKLGRALLAARVRLAELAEESRSNRQHMRLLWAAYQHYGDSDFHLGDIVGNHNSA